VKFYCLENGNKTLICEDAKKMGKIRKILNFDNLKQFEKKGFFLFLGNFSPLGRFYFTLGAFSRLKLSNLENL
jgi:hypothetical protein